MMAGYQCVTAQEVKRKEISLIKREAYLIQAACRALIRALLIQEAVEDISRIWQRPTL
jgi:hypothetical protein